MTRFLSLLPLVAIAVAALAFLVAVERPARLSLPTVLGSSAGGNAVGVEPSADRYAGVSSRAIGSSSPKTAEGVVADHGERDTGVGPEWQTVRMTLLGGAPGAADPGWRLDQAAIARAAGPRPPADPFEDGGVDRELVADVFIWDTTMQGLGALRAIQKTKERYPVGEVVIASSSSGVAAMPAQGLSVEDVYSADSAQIGGVWQEFRSAVLERYAAEGIRALNPAGRLVNEPRVAREVLRWYIDGGGAGRAGTTFVCAHLVDARYRSGSHEVVLRTSTGELVRVRARVLIDGSVEGDLARHMGARYRFGVSERVFGPTTGPPPQPQGSVPETWIQRVSALLTLRVYPGAAPPVAALVHPAYDPTRYNPSTAWTGVANLRSFGTSWSMTHVLPYDHRELNETWNDYPGDITLPHTYVFAYDGDPAVRGRLRDQVLRYSIDKVRFLQENGYPHVGIAVVPDRLYIREGLRVVGRDTYTVADIDGASIRDPVAFGQYARYDVHLPVTQDHVPAFVYVPIGALLAADLPDLLIPGPISTDHRAYNTAVRTEPVRANTGGAAGVIAAIAVARGLPPAGVSYQEVREELVRQGYRLGR